jgi:hypothetical protein
MQEILGAVANERILGNRNDVQVLDIAMNLNNVGEFGAGIGGGGVGFLGKGFTTEKHRDNA